MFFETSAIIFPFHRTTSSEYGRCWVSIIRTDLARVETAKPASDKDKANLETLYLRKKDRYQWQ